MKNKQFLDIMNENDDDLLLREELTSKRFAAKIAIRKKLILAASVALILTFSIAISYLSQIINLGTPSSNNNSTESIFYEDKDNCLYTTIESIYSLTIYSSMVHAKFVGVVNMQNRIFNTYCIIAEFQVIEDFYQKIDAGTTIYVPLTGLPNDAILSLLNTSDDYILFVNRLYPSFKMYAEDGTEFVMENVSSHINTLQKFLIPIQNGFINIEKLIELWDQYEFEYLPFRQIIGYTECIAQGMPYETAAENIRKLYQSQPTLLAHPVIETWETHEYYDKYNNN